MQLFALLILGGLVGFSSPQFVFGLSPRLDPRRESTLFDELSLEDTTPTDPTITFNSGGLPLDDFLSSATESDLDWLSENVDSNDPDSNNLFSEISYSNEPGASSLFANNDNACNVGIVVDTQLFGKKRREASSCKSTFTGEVENQNGSDGEDGPDRSGESNQESIPQIFPPLSIFPEDFDLCPPRIFKTSNIPVCRSLVEGTYMEIPGQLYVTLLDVKTLAPFIIPKMCYDSMNIKLWCCHELVFHPRNFMPLPDSLEETLVNEPLQEFQRVIGLKNYQYDANICWLQSLIQYGEPVGGIRRGFKS